MPLEPYPQAGFELLDGRLPIWRFMNIKTFARFIESASLYFCRADLFDDENEGLPLDEYVRQVVADMGPGHTFQNTWEELKQERQGSFVSCWTLDESIHMWEKFAPQGVAVKSRCELLEKALDSIPARAMVGQIRYSLRHNGFNILRFITTKRPKFSPEKEVRALVWDLEKSPRNPYPHDMPKGLSYPIDLISLVQSVIVAPQAPAKLQDEVRRLLGEHGYGNIPITKSGFTSYGHLLPNADEISRYSGK